MLRGLLAVLLYGLPAAALPATEAVDLIVSGDTVLLMDDAGTVLDDGAVAIRDGVIVDVGPAPEIAARYEPAEHLAGTGRIVLPGLVNGHTHAAMNMLRGLADDRELIDWLQNFIFPAEVLFADAVLVQVATEWACVEMIRGGTTTFVDMYYHPEAVAAAVEKCGIRGVIAPSIIDQESPDAADFAAGLAQAREFIEQWRGRHPRIIPILGVHSVFTVSPGHLQAARSLAEELNVPISIHVSETRFEIDVTRRDYDASPVEHMNKLDFLAGPTIGAHAVWTSAADIDILAERSVGVIHNPTSNMKISSGIAPIPQMLAAGVRVGLGTDGPATNNDLDMWEEMRLAAFLHKLNTMEPTVLPAETILRMATSDGAKAIGLGDKIGSLRPGFRADLIQVSTEHEHFYPRYDVVSTLVYAADEQDVVSVVVDGEIVMRERQVLTSDVPSLRRRVISLGDAIRDALYTGN